MGGAHNPRVNDCSTMKSWEDKYVFNFPWHIVIQSAYRKYPTKYNPNVRSLDVLERQVKGKRLYSHRLFSTLWNVPTIVLKILGANEDLLIHEQSVCDTETKILTIAGCNVSLRNLFKMHEVLEYTPHPDDPSKTILKQSAKMYVFGVPLFGDLLESLLVSSYGGVVMKGRLAVEEKSVEIMKEVQ